MLMKVNGVVRIVRDVEIHYNKSGTAIANLSVVSSKKYKTQSGEQKEDTTFIDCTAFSRLAEICNQYLRKGSQVYIVGELRQENWQTQDGSSRSKHIVVVSEMKMLDGKSDHPQNTSDQKPSYQQPARTAPQQPSQVPEIDIDEDEIPF